MYSKLNREAYRSGHNEAVLKTVWVQAHGGSNPSASAKKNADVAQVVEHILGKDEVTSSSLVISSKIRERNSRIFLYLRIEDIKCTILYIVRSCSSSTLGFCKYFVLASVYAWLL